MIWFIVFTAVNFHLVLFFFQFFIWPPSSASCDWVLRCGCGIGGWSCHPGSLPHCSWPFHSSVTSTLWPLWPLPLSPAHRPAAWHVPLLMLLWCSGDDSLCLLLHLHTPHSSYTPTPLPPSRWPTPLLPATTVSPTWARSPFPLPWGTLHRTVCGRQKWRRQQQQ